MPAQVNLRVFRGGAAYVAFLKDGAKVSCKTLSIINRHTHPPSLTRRDPGKMRSDEDGVHAIEEQPISVIASNDNWEDLFSF